jgi:hypothetical protein
MVVERLQHGEDYKQATPPNLMLAPLKPLRLRKAAQRAALLAQGRGLVPISLTAVKLAAESEAVS